MAWPLRRRVVHIVTKGINGHDGATARSVGVAALAGIAAVLLMG